MSRPGGRGEEPPRRRPLSPLATGIALAAIALLALAELTGQATAGLRLVLMVLVGLAGTLVMIRMAQRRCPHCGIPAGYSLRVTRTDRCRRCGAELPAWPGSGQ